MVVAGAAPGRQAAEPVGGDIGFLVFPVAAGAALLVWPAAGSVDRRRRVLDAAITTSALILVRRQPALSAVVDAGGSTLELTVSLAYPTGDLLVLVVLTLDRAGPRTTLVLAAAGTGCLL